MSEQIDWSKAPEGATHYYQATEEWYLAGDGCVPRVWAGMWCKAFQFAQREHECIPRPTTPSWSGEGLPPVGVVCEAAIPHTSGPDNERSFIWIEGSVIAYCEIKGKTYAWFAEDNGFYPPAVLEFRPIRTPEQIAADARSKEIDEMVKALGMDDPGTAEYIRCGLIYDAGFRKQ